MVATILEKLFKRVIYIGRADIGEAPRAPRPPSRRQPRAPAARRAPAREPRRGTGAARPAPATPGGRHRPQQHGRSGDRIPPQRRAGGGGFAGAGLRPRDQDARQDACARHAAAISAPVALQTPPRARMASSIAPKARMRCGWPISQGDGRRQHPPAARLPRLGIERRMGGKDGGGESSVAMCCCNGIRWSDRSATEAWRSAARQKP